MKMWRGGIFRSRNDVYQKNKFQSATKLVVVLLLGTLLLSACMVRLAYNNADWLLMWELDSSFDLTPPQKEFLNARLRQHLRWHRETELTKTIAFLRRLQTVVTGGVTPSELADAATQFATLRNRLVTQLAPDSAEFFAQVSDEQLMYLQKSLKKANKDWEKRIKLSPRERNIERTERILTIVTDWTGPLSSVQEQKITRSIERLPDVLELWLTHTKGRQQQFVELVRSARADRTVASSAFVTWITAETDAPELAAHRAAMYELIIEIDRLCTKVQHDHVVHKLQNWIDDLQLALAQEPE